MGTRADFYVGRGVQAEWLGSVAWDGHPSSFPAICEARTEEAFRAAVALEFASRDDVTLPEMGWPWPWCDSRTTDYAYAFDGGKVYASSFGHVWFVAVETPPEEAAEMGDDAFPDMRDRQNVTLGNRSGLLLLSIKD